MCGVLGSCPSCWLQNPLHPASLAWLTACVPWWCGVPQGVPEPAIRCAIYGLQHQVLLLLGSRLQIWQNCSPLVPP